MATYTTTYLVDDLTQKRGDDVETHSLMLDGIHYEIDLGLENYDELAAKLSPYLKAARRTAATKTSPAKKRVARGTSAPSRTEGQAPAFSATNPDPAEIRKWAKKRKISIAPRGRIPRSVKEQFIAVHSKSA